MSDHEARDRAVYDHSEEEPRPRRRRQVADWGVGEELFDGMPGRRFERRSIPRGGVEDGRRTIVIEPSDGDAPVVLPPEQDGEEFASREDALRAHEEHEALWGGEEAFAPEPEPVAEEPDPAPVAERDPGPLPERRTIKISGHPGEARMAASRRRPPRTVSERVGVRPDRIAAWAFALGILLILIAIATANI